MVDSITIELTAPPEPPADLALLAAVADPVRWQILNRLSRSGTTCVCDLQAAPAIPANLLSYHLKVLREAGLVTTARRGRWVDYTLAGDAADRLLAVLPTTHPSTTHPSTRR